MDNARPTLDPSVRKRPTNLSVRSDLLEKARSLGINLSATLEEALIERISERERERWTRENQPAIEAYNERVEADGSFGDRFRRF